MTDSGQRQERPELREVSPYRIPPLNLPSDLLVSIMGLPITGQHYNLVALAFYLGAH